MDRYSKCAKCGKPMRFVAGTPDVFMCTNKHCRHVEDPGRNFFNEVARKTGEHWLRRLFR